MALTVQDVLNYEGFSRANVVAGHRGLNRPVKSASFMEVPDVFSYLEQGTLLLTTLFPIAADEVQITTLIERLVSCGAAGICIKTRRFVERVPQAMISQGNQLGFPVIELDDTANLSSLAGHIVSASLDERVAQLQHLDQVRNTLSQLFSEDLDENDLIGRVGRIVRHRISLLDSEMNVMCAAAEDGSALPADEAEALVDCIRRKESRQSLLASKRLLPIVACNRRYGYLLALDCPSDGDERRNLTAAMGQSLSLFISLFLKNDAVAESRKGFRDVILRDLLLGREAPSLELQRKMDTFGLSLLFPLHIVGIKVFAEDEAVLSAYFQMLVARDSTLCRPPGENGAPLYAIYHDGIIVLIGYREDPKVLKSWFVSQLGAIEGIAAPSRPKVGIGISDACHGIQELSSAFAQARMVLKTGNSLNRVSFVDTYSRHRIFSLVNEVADSEALMRFIRSKIGAVIDYDARHNTNLIETLGMLIDGDLNYKTVARQSFMHYNTIRYRAAKLTQLGLTLKPGRGFAEIVLAHDAWVWISASHSRNN